MNQEFTKQLQELGLSDKESLIYIQSLQIGSAPASILGKRGTINRSTAQYICQSLTQKGLMNVLQKNNAYIYTAESPEKLKILLQREQKKLDQKSSNLEQTIKSLHTFQGTALNESTAKYYQGSHGIIEMFEDVIQENKPLYAATRITQDSDPTVHHYIQNDYQLKRQKIKNTFFMKLNSFIELIITNVNFCNR